MVFPCGATLKQHSAPVIKQEYRDRAVEQAGSVRDELFLRADLAVGGVDEDDPLFARQDGAFPPGCTKRQPNRPLMQRFPRVIELSSGDVALTMAPSCSCSVSVQPTPQ
jgi:hypothetical protein